MPRKAARDIASVAAYDDRSNRMANVADMRPNEEFHALGRTQPNDG